MEMSNSLRLLFSAGNSDCFFFSGLKLIEITYDNALFHYCGETL